MMEYLLHRFSPGGWEPGDLLLLIGLSSAFFGACTLHQETAPARWIKIKGTIVNTQIDASTVSIPNSISRVTVYIPRIDYEYFHKGELYRSSRRRPDNYIPGGLPVAEAVLARYPIRSKVTVYVNPRKPELSALEYGISPLSWLPLGLGFLFAIVGLI